jgi:DNA transposition AAA+ family ATPase
MVKTKDVRSADSKVGDLLDPTADIETMGCLWGPPGTGKTTTLAYLTNLYDGIFIRALGCSTVTSILGDLCLMLGGKRLLRRADMVEFICERLTKEDGSDRPLAPRPIFVDEADYCFRQFEILDSLRDIYDISGCPVILVGMEDIARTIRENGRFARRITQWIEFKGLDLIDTAQVALETCEVEVREDLIEYVHRETAGNIGRVKIGLDKIEKFARGNGLTAISLADWGERPLYFDQPIFGKPTKGTPPKHPRK